jgi:hypothetical protein
MMSSCLQSATREPHGDAGAYLYLNSKQEMIRELPTGGASGSFRGFDVAASLFDA